MQQPAGAAGAAQCWFLYFSDWKKNRLGPSEKSQHIFQVSSHLPGAYFYFYFYFLFFGSFSLLSHSARVPFGPGR
jgi:hypothetical protein